MNKKEAEQWCLDIINDGTCEDRTEYKKHNEIGSMAERMWGDAKFTYGMEYGILIAVWKIFGGEE